MSYHTLLPTLSRQQFSRHSPQTAIKRTNHSSNHPLPTAPPPLLFTSAASPKHTFNTSTTLCYFSANESAAPVPISPTDNTTAPTGANQPLAHYANHLLHPCHPPNVSTDIPHLNFGPITVSAIGIGSTEQPPVDSSRNHSIKLPPGHQSTSLRFNGPFPIGVSFLLACFVTSLHKTAVLLPLLALRMPIISTKRSYIFLYKTLLGIYLSVFIALRSSLQPPASNATFSQANSYKSISLTSRVKSSNDQSSLPCQCSRAYLFTKTGSSMLVKRRIAATIFILLQFMIVFTNPVTMANKTYLKSNNTRTNESKRTPPRKASATPGKVPVSKPLPAGAQKKKVQQTLLSKPSNKTTPAPKATQANTIPNSGAKPNVSYAAVTSSPPRSTKNPYKAPTITPSEPNNQSKPKPKTASAHYRNKVVNGSLPVDKEEYQKAKSNAYSNWTPSAPAKKDANNDGDSFTLSTTPNSSFDEGSKMDEDLTSPPRNVKNADIEAFSPKKPEVVDLRQSESSDDESIVQHPTKNDEEHRRRRQEAARKAAVEAEAMESSSSGSDSSSSDSSKSDSESDQETSKSKSHPKQPTKQPPAKQSTSKASATTNGQSTNGPASSTSPSSSTSYDPPTGTYSRVLSVLTTTYYSGHQLEKILVEAVKSSNADPILSPCHHINGPFQVIQEPNLSNPYLILVNCHKDRCYNLGPPPSSDLSDAEEDACLPASDFHFSPTNMTSLHYPLNVLQNLLRKVCLHHQNSPESPSFPSKGPFRVEVVDGVLALRNSGGEQVVNVPFPNVLDDPTRPWQFGEVSPDAAMDEDVHFTGDDMDTDAPTPPESTDEQDQPTPPESSGKPDQSTLPESTYKPDQPQNAFRTTPTPKKPGVVPKFKPTKKSTPAKSTNQSASSDQDTSSPSGDQPSNQSATNTSTENSKSSEPPSSPPNATSIESQDLSSCYDRVSNPVNLAAQLNSALRSSSYATPPQNPLPANDRPPNSDSTPSPTSQLVVGLGDLPKNKSGAIFVVLSVPPIPNTHPCNFLLGGIQVFLSVGSKFDRSLVLCPLFNKDGSLPTIPAAVPQAFPASYESLLPYVDVPNENSLRTAKGKDRKGKKREQGAVYCTLSINSDIDCRHLVRVLSPLLDMRRMSLTVKPLQRVRSVTWWYIGAGPTGVCPKGLMARIRYCLEQEIAKAKTTSTIYDINEVPELVLSSRVTRVPPSHSRNSSSEPLTLENYDSFLRRAWHPEVSEFEADDLNALFLAAEKSKILQEEVCSKMHIICLGREGYSPDPAVLSAKLEGHMAFVAGTSTVLIRGLVDPFRKVQVKMAPLPDGSVPEAPCKYTSVFKEITNFVDEDGKQMFFSIIPTMEGPDVGSSTLVLKNTEHAERVALAFAKHPAAWLYHFLLAELGFREDSVISILRSFTAETRGLVTETTWCSETWSVVSPYSHISDTFNENLENEGFVLTDANLSARNETAAISQVMAREDLAQLKADLFLKDDATCGTKGDGVSIISGATGFTVGDSSLRSVTEQDINREIEQACIANAKRMEAEAKARWGSDLASVHTSATDTASPTAQRLSTNPPIPSSIGGNATDVDAPTQSKSPASGSNESGNPPSGEPASTKQSGPGNDPSKSDLNEGAGGPRGPR